MQNDYKGQSLTLDDVYSYLNPTFPLKQEGSDQKYWDWFYVERARDTLKTLVRAIRHNSLQGNLCLLYSGHMGCGKSTELQRVAHEPSLKKDFVVIHYSVKDELDPANVDFADIIISIAAKLFIVASELDVKLSELSLREIREWKDAVIEHSDTLIGSLEVKTQANISAFFLQFLGILKGSKEQKESYTVKIKPRINQLIEIINKRLVLEINAGLGKQALVILDDLEKVSLEKARSIFKDHGHLLASLRCNVIYTFPIALEYGLERKLITSFFGDVIRLPNIKLRDKKGVLVPENQKLMKEMVYRRMKPELIEEKALEKALEYSGGMIRELFRILHKACDRALNQDVEKITEEHVNAAIANLRNDYIYSLEERHYPFLKRVYETKEVEGSQEYVQLMDSLHILKYANDEDWFDLNPMIRERVEEKFKILSLP